LEFRSEDLIHHCLEGSQGVCEAEEHDSWFKESLVRYEGCFSLISLLDPYVVVAPPNIEFREEGCSFYSIDKFWNEGERVSILDGPLIHFSVVLDRSQFPVFLFDEEEWGSVRALRWSDISFL
jgi:hypothetical protein